MNAKILFLILGLTLTACSTRKVYEEPTMTVPAEKPKKIERATEPPKPAAIVVDNKDLAVLEKMNAAVEAYVLKNEPKAFMNLCKDKRFDCFIDDKPHPKRKAKIQRRVPPYATGSKMGLQEDNRIHIRYDFYP